MRFRNVQAGQTLCGACPILSHRMLVGLIVCHILNCYSLSLVSLVHRHAVNHFCKNGLLELASQETRPDFNYNALSLVSLVQSS